ncbi:DUF222 domain-containing protein [Microbacterium indicum]|uniref:DUF222 domain-containing protein n=1 Tax=Microbacterium indicum TaxID=358100 RepID=UPI0012EB921F|nr:DUF222 domain-containing protein [Microbacterium indicum]
MTPEERERADGALAALETARQLRAGADSLAASAQAVPDRIAEAQARRIPSTGDARDLPYRSMAEEVASAMRVSRHVASARLRESSDLARSYPATQQALREGAISEEHVRALLAEGSALAADDAARVAYECECLDVARVSTAPQTRTAARVIADRLLDRDVEQAHAQAKARRRVSVRDLGDGMSELYAVAESTVIRGALDRLTTMGRRVAHAHRTAHQLHTPGGTALGEIRAAVQVMIPVGLMTGEVTGRPRGRPLLEYDQPIGAAEARRLAALTPTWDRIFVARDGTCRFPGRTTMPGSAVRFRDLSATAAPF